MFPILNDRFRPSRESEHAVLSHGPVLGAWHPLSGIEKEPWSRRVSRRNSRYGNITHRTQGHNCPCQGLGIVQQGPLGRSLEPNGTTAYRLRSASRHADKKDSRTPTRAKGKHFALASLLCLFSTFRCPAWPKRKKTTYYVFPRFVNLGGAPQPLVLANDR